MINVRAHVNACVCVCVLLEEIIRGGNQYFNSFSQSLNT